VDGTFRINEAEPVYRARHHDNRGLRGIESHIISESGSLKLDQYLPDTEVPFASNIVDQGGCRVHFIVVWRALSRTSKVSYDPVGIDVRIVTEVGSRVVSNRSENLSFLSAEAAYTQDIYGGGQREYVFIGGDNSEHLYIWTINENCSPEKIAFEDEDGETSDEATGKEISLKRQANGSYAVHTKMSEPIGTGAKDGWSVTETIYTWDASLKRYKMTKTITSRS